MDQKGAKITWNCNGANGWTPGTSRDHLIMPPEMNTRAYPAVDVHMLGHSCKAGPPKLSLCSCKDTRTSVSKIHGLLGLLLCFQCWSKLSNFASTALSVLSGSFML